MGGFRALNKHKSNDKLTKLGIKRTYRDVKANNALYKQSSAAVEEQHLKLIKLTSEQEASKEVKFVFDLPTTREAIANLLKEFKTKENTLIGRQRIRDFYNPTLSENAGTKDDFMRFVICLLQTYIEQEGDGQTEAILQHLKELASVEVVGQTMAGYLAN